MYDPRQEKLAKLLLEYSLGLKPKDRLYINAIDTDPSFVEVLIKEAKRLGAYPRYYLNDTRLTALLYDYNDEDYMKEWGAQTRDNFRHTDCYLAISGNKNAYEYSGVPAECMQMYRRLVWTEMNDELDSKKAPWCILNYPNPSVAQMAKMTTPAFEDFFYKVCTVDYQKMDEAMNPLVELINKTDKVRVTARDTDITFSIKGIGAVKCAGKNNIPDGEVFTAPVRDSVNGVITFNTPTLYQGIVFENVSLTFENGKIVKATAGANTERLNQILDTDEGARYVGEFALGVNPLITKPMLDTLFDEKIAGSFHFTPGKCYDEAPNGNNSAIHWDMVLIQTPEWGGGDIWFDDVLVRHDGRFVPDSLAGLNPENLK